MSDLEKTIGETVSEHQEALQRGNVIALIFLKPGYDKPEIREVVEDELGKRNLQIASQGKFQFDQEKAAEFYQHHQDRPWFNTLVGYLVSQPVHYYIVFSSKKILAENLYQEIGKIATEQRKRFGRRNEKAALRKGANVIHVSGSSAEAFRELEILGLELNEF